MPSVVISVPTGMARVFISYDPSKPKRAPGIDDKQWNLYKPLITRLHEQGVTRAHMLNILGENDFRPSNGQLVARLKLWGLMVYRQNNDHHLPESTLPDHTHLASNVPNTPPRGPVEPAVDEASAPEFQIGDEEQFCNDGYKPDASLTNTHPASRTSAPMVRAESSRTGMEAGDRPLKQENEYPLPHPDQERPLSPPNNGLVTSRLGRLGLPLLVTHGLPTSAEANKNQSPLHHDSPSDAEQRIIGTIEKPLRQGVLPEFKSFPQDQVDDAVSLMSISTTRSSLRSRLRSFTALAVRLRTAIPNKTSLSSGRMSIDTSSTSSFHRITGYPKLSSGSENQQSIMVNN